MSDWTATTLGVVLERPEPGTRPAGGANCDSGEIPSFGGENIRPEGGVLYEPVKKVPRSFYLRMQQGILRNLDVLINKDGAQTGKVGIYRDLYYPEACVNEHLFILRSRSGAVDQSFLFHLLNNEASQLALRPFITGSAQAGLKSSFVDHVSFALPKREEQRAIAAILDAADEAIAKTEALIAKLKSIKQGLLHDLLTRGLDENGELRDPEKHPEQFKETPLGRVPNNWSVSELREHAGVYGGKRLPSGHEYASAPTNLYYLRVVDFYQRELDFASMVSLYPQTFELLARYEIHPGDVFISIAGSLGYAGVFEAPQGTRTILTENAARIVPSSELRPFFLSLEINSPLVQGQIEQLKGVSGGVPKLALFRIESLYVAVPPIEEQERIENAVAAQDRRIESEQAYLSKLKAIKKGLMQDLLTGRVRVPAEKIAALATG
jgi:type I restriction enzyme S subunit